MNEDDFTFGMKLNGQGYIRIRINDIIEEFSFRCEDEETFKNVMDRIANYIYKK